MHELDVPSTCQVVGLEHIYYGVFRDIADGVFVEAGAYDGLTHSNTWPLAKIGWSGLLIEPVNEFYDRCVGNHAHNPNVKVINAAVSDKVDIVNMTTDGRELFTLDSTVAEVLKATEPYKAVNTVTLDGILLTHNIDQFFDLLVIDVEGHELKVLEGFSVYYWRPRMVIIEAHERHKDERLRSNANFINTYFAIAGYTRIYSDAVNNIYVS